MRPVRVQALALILSVMAGFASADETRPGQFGLSPNQIPGMNPGLMNPFGPKAEPGNRNAGLIATFRQRGIQAYNRRDYFGASQFFRQALLLDPGNQNIRFELMEAERAKRAQRSPRDVDPEAITEELIANQKRLRQMIDEDAAKSEAAQQKETTSETASLSDAAED